VYKFKNFVNKMKYTLSGNITFISNHLKTEKSSPEVPKNKLYICQQCTYIVYMYNNLYVFSDAQFVVLIIRDLIKILKNIFNMIGFIYHGISLIIS